MPELARLGPAAKLMTATAIVYHIAFSGCAARAEDRPWKPRRHHRRMGERFTDKWAEELVEEQESLRERTAEEMRLQRLRLQKQREADEKRIREEEATMKARATEILIKQQEAARVGGLPFKLVVGGADLAPLVVWGAIAAALWAAYKGRLLDWLTGGGRAQRGAGKWVYDRSLGGKKVWVPDSSSFAGPTSATSYSEKAGTSLKDDEFDKLATFAAAARTGGAVSSEPFSTPAWWDPPPVLYVSDRTRREREKEAAAVLARLESSKNTGKDYEMEDIRALRRLCQEGHVAVKPKTVGGRDALYRAAVEAAVDAAQRNNLSGLDGSSPPRWVAGVAADIGMDEERAVGIVAAVAAAAARARLLDATASLRRDPPNVQEAVFALARLAALLQLLPVLQPGRPEVSVVASSLRDRSSPEQRTAMFYLLAQMLPEGQRVTAELLGFDAEVIMREQESALEAARRNMEAEIASLSGEQLLAEQEAAAAAAAVAEAAAAAAEAAAVETAARARAAADEVAAAAAAEAAGKGSDAGAGSTGAAAADAKAQGGAASRAPGPEAAPGA
ncbi:hypothetical protein HYH03_017229 [Edaphochlamys debaryana]|uniref:Uncharacterized protein n=1 Tax=Edaphochlamys debaryana TaxID=47281 RepID=A0A835XJF2_9CHLO|nr:hypothetical protein HYH03_017229 [Edaphochlamys debaryana]|eukprot:KAG2483908.1 hypothetical protein HYH03_017229 [Edaphochlamys debaryana]